MRNIFATSIHCESLNNNFQTFKVSFMRCVPIMISKNKNFVIIFMHKVNKIQSIECLNLNINTV